MADRPVSPIEPAVDRAEMNTTDAEHEQETGRVSPLGHETSVAKPAAKTSSPKPRVSFQETHDEAPPQKPPRPLSPQQQAEITLIEAFPSIDAKVVQAVLHASGGNVEPAFNALLGMTDPDFQPEQAAPPPQPPRPAQRQPQTQLEADEMYARQLAEQYNGTGGARAQTRYNQREPGRRGPNQQRPRYDEEDREHSFFDDDLPEIGRNIQQGFAETQKKFNSWISTVRKKIEGEDEEEDLYSGSAQQPGSRQRPGGRQNFGPSQSEQLHGIRKSAEAQRRRSTEAQRYDADPHELDDDAFERLELRDEEAPPPQPPRTSSRKSANPDLFKSQPPRPPQSGPVDEVDAAERHAGGGSTSSPEKGGARKWQPLTSVTPHPEEDNDPFSLGDDDDDAAAATKEKGEDLRKEDSERLKRAASGSVSAGVEGGKELQEGERSGSTGTRNKEMEDLMAGKKE